MRRKRHKRRQKLKSKRSPFLIFGLTLVCIFSLWFVNQYIYRIYPPTESHKKVRILIVPGHEPTLGGTEFRDIKERDLVVEIGDTLKQLLETDSEYEVFISRDKMIWNPIFADYFEKNWDEIIKWKKETKQEYTTLVSSGSIKKPVVNVRHNTVLPNQSIRLYGITKWVNENDIDLMVHIHINDDAEHARNVAGKYSGFTIYVPQKSYENGKESHAIAKQVFNVLSKYNSVSNLGKESLGVVEESKLIAVGAYNSSSVPSILVEYGYIYESKFESKAAQTKTVKRAAEEIYTGLKNYFK